MLDLRDGISRVQRTPKTKRDPPYKFILGLNGRPLKSSQTDQDEEMAFVRALTAKQTADLRPKTAGQAADQAPKKAKKAGKGKLTIKL